MSYVYRMRSNACRYASLQRRAFSVHRPRLIQRSVPHFNLNTVKPTEIVDKKTTQTTFDFINKFPEELRSDSNGMKSTRAENQFDTLRFYNLLKTNGFTEEQSQLIVDLLIDISNENFFDTYNNAFLRGVELDNQAHLFHVAESELKYLIQNSRETQINDLHLNVMKLNRDLEALHDQLHGMVIDHIQKDSKVDFNNRKIENSLLIRTISLELQDCKNRISTKILGNLKSEVEVLRWETTRSGLFAILILVFLIMSGVSISRQLTAENDKPKEVILHTIVDEEQDEINSESNDENDFNLDDTAKHKEWLNLNNDNSHK